MSSQTITSTADVLSADADPTRPRLLARLAVVTTSQGLEDIAAAHVVWETGQRARRNRDAVGSRQIADGSATLRMPEKDLVSIVAHHRPDDLAALRSLPGMTVDDRGSLVLTTAEPDALRSLASRLIDIALEVDRSPLPQVDPAKTDLDHDTQQVLLRASQALVLADELEVALQA